MHFFRVVLNLWLCLREIVARNSKNFKMRVMRQEVACCLHGTSLWLQFALFLLMAVTLDICLRGRVKNATEAF